MKNSKKFFSLMLSAALLLFACSAFAESSLFDSVYIDPDTYDFSQTNWVEFDSLFRVARPDNWIRYECSDEETESGGLYKMGPEDGSVFITVFSLGADSEYAKHFVSESEAYSYLVELNGLTAARLNYGDELFAYCYYSESIDSFFIVLPYEDGTCYVLSCAPVQNEETREIVQAICYSIRVAEAS